MFTLQLAIAVGATLLGLSQAQSTPRACNNSPLLCDRTYDNVTYLGAHDSMFVRNASNRYSLSGNQFFTSPVQLDAGVRLLTGQVHTTGSGSTFEINLCHTICLLYNAGTLSGWLASIKEWLDNNPNEVVTILLVNSDNLASSTYQPIFDSVNITQYIYAPPVVTQSTTSWPTLNEMINMNKRLVVYFQPLDTDSSLLLNQYTFVFENNYDVTNPNNFSCVASRPDTVTGNTALALSENLLPLTNHFLDTILIDNIEIPNVGNASTTNAPSGAVGNLGDAADACTQAYGKPPTYIIVDFFNVGPAIDTVDRLNGVTGDIVGRRSVPDQIYTSGPGPTATLPLYDSTTAVPSITTTTTGTSSATDSASATATSSATGTASVSISGSASSSAVTTASGSTIIVTPTGPYSNSTNANNPTLTGSIGIGTIISSGLPNSSLLPGTSSTLGRRDQAASRTTVLAWISGVCVAIVVPLFMLRH